MEVYGGTVRQSSRGYGDAAYAATNGMLSRPGGNVPAQLSREDSVQSLSNGSSTRAQQPSHEVFMVREAARTGASSFSSSSTTDRSPFASSGNRYQDEGSGHGGGGSVGGGGLHHSRSSEKDKDKGSFSSPKILKIAVVGDSTAGKTAICNAFTSEGYNFSRNYHMTTGVSIYAKSIKLPSNKGSIVSPSEESLSLEPRINLVLVDSAGKPIYRELLPQYWDRLDGIALVIDLTSSTALETATDWLNLAKGCITSSGGSSGGAGDNQSKHLSAPDPSGDRSGDQHQSFLGVLIGTKNDLKDLRVISPKAAQDFASRHALQYFECSAKENSGIEEPFFFLAHQWTTKLLSSGGPLEKENMDGEGSTIISGGGGMRISGTRSNGSSNSNNTSGTPASFTSSSRKSALQSRQNSSEAF